MRHLVIVSRDRPDLYEKLVRRFCATSTVQVITDRRLGERRNVEVEIVTERRREDRRQHADDVAAILWTAGCMTVRTS